MLKKIIVLIILIITFIISISFNNDKLSYVSIGDGLSKGINYNNYQTNSYSDYIATYLRNNNKLNNYSNEFTSENYRITDLVNEINNNISINNITIQETIKKADIITISIGMNEIMYKYNDKISAGYMYEYIDDLIKDLDILLKKLTKLNKNKIFLLSLYNPQENKELDKYIRYANNKIINLLNIYSITYIDTYNIFNNNKHLIYNKNNYYPNQDGYKLIAKEIIKKL